MFAWIRMALILGGALTVIYLCLSWYSRSVRREKLEKEFDSGGIGGDRDAFIKQGLKDYDGSLRRKLIWAVYVIPVIGVIGLIYVVNFM
jgi:hypothetical protein